MTKQIIFLFIFCIILLGAHQLISAPATSGIALDKLTQAIENSAQKAYFQSGTLNMVIQFEKPTEYQKKQIYHLFNTLCAEAKKSGIQDIKNLIAFINARIPDNPNHTQDTTLFKYAFARNEGDAPKGSFDCDSRSLLVLSVLEALGKSKNIKMVDLTGHVILTDVSTHEYFDLTLPNIQVHPKQDKLLFSNILFTDKDLQSLLLSNIATEYIINGQGNVLSRKKSNKDALEQAQDLLQQAIMLNPRNIAAINNLKPLINAMPYTVYGENELEATKIKKQQKALCNVQILAVLVKNYTSHNQATIPDFTICKETSYCPAIPKHPSNDFAKAFQGSTFIANYTLHDVLSDLFFSDYYEEVLPLGQELLKDNTFDSIKFYEFYKEMAISAAMIGDFDSYEQIRKQMQKWPAEMMYVEGAVNIIRGKTTAQQMAQSYINQNAYPNDLYEYVVNGSYNKQMFYAIELLDAWNEFATFQQQVHNLIPTHN